MASISLTQSGNGFYGYKDGNTTYGYYNVTFDYSSVSRSGTTITVKSASITMKNPNSGYTTNTVSVDSVTINDTDVDISGSANGGTAYHTLTTTAKDITFSAPATTTSVTVTLKASRNGAYANTQTLTGTLTIPRLYTVTYNANGGSGSMASSEAQIGVNFVTRKNSFTRTGYTFNGWNEKADGTGVAWKLTSTGVYENGNGTNPWVWTYNYNITLYAQWEQITYTVSYNANGGSGAPAAQTKTYGTALTLSSTKPTFSAIDGYTFYKWNTAADGSGTYYSAGASYTTNSAVTLYAIYSKVCTLSYNANGGSNAPSSQNFTVYGIATNGNVTVTTDEPYRRGYTFLGWNNSATATKPLSLCDPGKTLTISGNLTLYAVWQINSYYLSIDPNGGYRVSDKSTSIITTSLDYGTTYTVDERRRDNYTLRGYSIAHRELGSSADLGDTDFSFDSSTKIGTFKQGTVPITLTAQWALNTYTVKYNANGGNGAPGNQTKTHGTALTLSSTKPTRTGYYFDGWNTKKDGTGTSYAAGASYIANSAVTLYAQWSLLYYTVYYYGNRSDVSLDLLDAISGSYAHGTSLKVASSTPTREGYTFVTWNTKPDGSGTNYAPGAAFGTLTAPISFYAIWKVNTLTVKFDSNGATTFRTDITDQVFAYNETSTSSNIKNYMTNGFWDINSSCTKTGHTATGYWLVGSTTASTKIHQHPYGPDKAAGGEDYYYTSTIAIATALGKLNALKNGNTSVTLYAEWKKDTYTVSYNANGGSGAPSSQTKTYGSNLTLSSTKPTRTNYTFAGWNTKADGTGTSYAAGATYSTNAAVTLYAQWTLVLSACGTPTSLIVTANNDNTVTISCKVGSNGVGNNATGVELLVCCGKDPKSNTPDYTYTLDGATSKTVSTTISFKEMSKTSASNLLGSSCICSIQCIARTLGAAGSGYYSSYTSTSKADFTWHEKAVAPTISRPKQSGVTCGTLNSYKVTWTAGAGGINNAFSSYSVRVYDETTKETTKTYSTTDLSKSIPASLLVAGHTYRFYVKTVGAVSGFDSSEAKSGLLTVKDIVPFTVLSPTISNANIVPSTNIYGETTFLNLGSGLVMKISWPTAVASNNELKHYELRLVDPETSATILTQSGIHENIFYVTADLLNNCPEGINKLAVYIDAVSTYGTVYGAYTENPVITTYANHCSGIYTKVTDGYTSPVMKIAVAFVKVPKNDGTGAFVWKLAQKSYTRDGTDIWQTSDIKYNVLTDENGDIVTDENDVPIYTL